MQRRGQEKFTRFVVPAVNRAMRAVHHDRTGFAIAATVTRTTVPAILIPAGSAPVFGCRELTGRYMT